jgi:hypothetical protein
LHKNEAQAQSADIPPAQMWTPEKNDDEQLLSSPVSRSRSGMSIVLFCTQLGAIQPRRRRCLRIISPIEKMSARGAPRGGAPAGLFGPPCCCHNDHCYRRDCELPVEMTSRSPQQLDNGHCAGAAKNSEKKQVTASQRKAKA